MTYVQSGSEASANFQTYNDNGQNQTNDQTHRQDIHAGTAIFYQITYNSAGGFQPPHTASLPPIPPLPFVPDPNLHARSPQQQEVAGPMNDTGSIVPPQPEIVVITHILQVLNDKIEQFAVTFSESYGNSYLDYELGSSTLAKCPQTVPGHSLFADLVTFGISRNATGGSIVVPCLRCLLNDRLLQIIFGTSHQSNKVGDVTSDKDKIAADVICDSRNFISALLPPGKAGGWPRNSRTGRQLAMDVVHEAIRLHDCIRKQYASLDCVVFLPSSATPFDATCMDRAKIDALSRAMDMGGDVASAQSGRIPVVSIALSLALRTSGRKETFVKASVFCRY